MPLGELVDRLNVSSTSRRTVVKTGAKLAYAAPLVAASFKLSGQGASALSPVACTAQSACSFDGPFGCNGNATCSCAATVDGSTACFQWNLVGQGGACSAADPCPAGEACIKATCVGDICQPLCAAQATSLSVAASSTTGPNTP